MAKPSRQERFLSLLDEHKKILYKVSAAYCRNLADRQDLAQEITAQLWRSFDRYDAGFAFSTWMYRVALNVAISFYRSESRRVRDIVPTGESILEIAEDRGSADAGDRLLLHDLIGQLDELDRALILLYLDGNRYDTIAEILGISETNVGTKLNRIKQKLRDAAQTA